jgi:hypothetical protein
LTGGGEALEHSGGAQLRERLMGVHRLGFERTRSMNLNSQQIRETAGNGERKWVMNGTTAMDKGPGVKNSRNWSVLEEAKTATMEVDKSDWKKK